MCTHAAKCSEYSQTTGCRTYIHTYIHTYICARLALYIDDCIRSQQTISFDSCSYSYIHASGHDITTRAKPAHCARRCSSSDRNITLRRDLIRDCMNSCSKQNASSDI